MRSRRSSTPLSLRAADFRKIIQENTDREKDDKENDIVKKVTLIEKKREEGDRDALKHALQYPPINENETDENMTNTSRKRMRDSVSLLHTDTSKEKTGSYVHSSKDSSQEDDDEFIDRSARRARRLEFHNEKM